MRVLVVDDNQTIIEKLSRFFQTLGFDVTTASNGLNALEKYHCSHFDLLITDHLMPVMNGIQLGKNLKQYSECAELPIFLMTTQGASSLSIYQREGIFSAIIDKPINEENLIQLINRFTSKNTSQSSL